MNQAIIVGHLGQDAEVGQTESGKKYARLSVATGESWTDKTTGEKKEKTQWHRVVCWGDGLADWMARDAKKGQKIHVVGKLTTREYEKDGVKKYTTEIVVQGGGGMVNLLKSTPGGVPAPADEPDGYAKEHGQ